MEPYYSTIFYIGHIEIVTGKCVGVDHQWRKMKEEGPPSSPQKAKKL